ncbi:MAG: LacI family transcriptional regulator [endosymbiont of Galathealinum brachiosum]|uniref:LacI family transcriptional regulator n=1 Tax=endosymbiont of Galathealinum brachiosum TaxID=2200906 RepID=A0A370DJP5_9GAMM|nr:MAG: LacI family transcriptional regulator [endosymbiont of Galathealinum brachiosum]
MYKNIKKSQHPMNAHLFKLFTKCIVLITIIFSINIQLSHADKSEHDKQYIVGFAQDTLANDWRRAQVNELITEFKKHPEIKLIVTDAGGDSAKQIQDIENLAYQKVDVLITSPRNGVTSTPAISRVYKQGIPVVLITRTITSDDYTTLIAPDDYQIATKAGEYISKKLSGKGNVLVLRGVPTATTAIARTDGFMNSLKRYPGIKVSAIKDANYLRGDAITQTEAAIMENIAFDAIYSQSDSMAVGARLALKKAGISPKEKLIVGIDYINEAREAIRTGNQSASFVYPTCAKETAEIVLRILHGKSVPKIVRVESKIITKENVEKISPIF